MSNKLKFTRRLKQDSDGGMHSDGYDVYGGEDHQTHLGKVEFRAVPAEWVALYDGRAVGTHSTRQGAGDRLRIEHERIWGPLSDTGAVRPDQRPIPDLPPTEGKLDPRPVQSAYAVVSGQELRDLRERINYAIRTGRAARFTVHNGLKIDLGYGWSAAIGRPADETGH